MKHSSDLSPDQVPDLSVVVIAHDVEQWLGECLESVASCTPTGTEVIVVDDGSGDRSGEIADDVARRHPRWRVLHRTRSGPGAARNAGIEAATGRYLGFVDGDDVVLPAYGELLERAVGHGHDVVVGRVLRTDGTRQWPSALHQMALAHLGDTAELGRDPSLVFDSTCWNKVYRRDLLTEHAIRFGEGVLYEDLEFAIEALFFAGEIGVVSRPVYAWRARTQGLSITQRRYEISNLRDRFAAVSAVDAFLHRHGLDDVRAAHDDKVLRLDLPLYADALPESDQEYRAAYLTFCHHLLATTPERSRRALPPTQRLYVELAAAGRMDDLVRAVAARRGERAWVVDDRSRWQKVRQDLAVYPLELELGLSTWPQVVRRAGVRTVTLLLPTGARRRLSGLRKRLRAVRASGPRVGGVLSDASIGRDRTPRAGQTEPPALPERQATNE